jgi:hypothetical protein
LQADFQGIAILRVAALMNIYRLKSQVAITKTTNTGKIKANSTSVAYPHLLQQK